MHELSLCYGMLKQLQHIAQTQQANRISHIRLQIGPLAGVEIELLKQSFPLASRGTMAEGAELEIEQRPVSIRCKNCAQESEVETNQLTCPLCHSSSTQLISGDEMLIHSIKVCSQPEPEQESEHV